MSIRKRFLSDRLIITMVGKKDLDYVLGEKILVKSSFLPYTVNEYLLIHDINE